MDCEVEFNAALVCGLFWDCGRHAVW
jgi:hypothetical protein